jgi:hypothetical protein
MSTPLENEIDEIAREIDRLKEEGDPDGRAADLSAYLRVLHTKLALELQKDPGRWGNHDGVG